MVYLLSRTRRNYDGVENKLDKWEKNQQINVFNVAEKKKRCNVENSMMHRLLH